MTTKHTTPLVKKGFIVQKQQNGLSIFDPDESTLFTINDSGALIFDLLKKKKDITVIVEKIANNYNIESKRAAKDVEHFISNLKKHGIVS